MNNKVMVAALGAILVGLVALVVWMMNESTVEPVIAEELSLRVDGLPGVPEGEAVAVRIATDGRVFLADGNRELTGEDRMRVLESAASAGDARASRILKGITRALTAEKKAAARRVSPLAERRRGRSAADDAGAGGTSSSGGASSSGGESGGDLSSEGVAEQIPEEPVVDLTPVNDYSEAIADVIALANDDVAVDATIAAEFKAEFDRMTPEQRTEHVHEILNLFDDSYLPVLKAIAVDASEPAETLEKVVYDLGNRDWDKVRPIMQEIANRSGHPEAAAAKEWLADHPASAEGAK